MSAGGGLAIDFTLKYPQKVSSLIVVGAVVSGFDYSANKGLKTTLSDAKAPILKFSNSF